VGEGGPLDDLIGHSITYRIAAGPRAGQKLFTLQTVPAREPESEQQSDGRGAANAGGFSLHACIDIQAHQREKLKRLCRYVSRPAIAVERLALTLNRAGFSGGLFIWCVRPGSDARWYFWWYENSGSSQKSFAMSSLRSEY
jgi:hypothetical protein